MKNKKKATPAHNGFAEINLSQVLADRAKNNPYWLLSADDLAHLFGVSIDAIYAARHAGAPFAYGKSRPEWLLKFFETSSGQLSIKSGRTSKFPEC